MREYDGTQDGMLDFDEFSQLVLPSTNPNLRHIASSRRFSPYFRASAPVAYEVLSAFGRLLDKEMQLQRAKAEQKRSLASCPDFVKVRCFDSIARGYPAINMPDLIFFLEKNSFFPRREDVEAILRRCDHDANRQINFSEFSELTSTERAPQASRAQPAQADSDDVDLQRSEEPVEAQAEPATAVAEDTEEAKDGPGEPREASAAKSSPAKRKKAPADNLTSEQRKRKRAEEEKQATAQRQELERQLEVEKQKIKEEQERKEQEEKER